MLEGNCWRNTQENCWRFCARKELLEEHTGELLEVLCQKGTAGGTHRRTVGGFVPERNCWRNTQDNCLRFCARRELMEEHTGELLGGLC